MTWFKVDDSFYDHPKVFDAPDSAVALWIRAGTWSARNLTDGFVPTKMPARFCDDPDTAVRELVRRGLWLRVKDGYRFHDWEQYQPTRESVEREREAAAERQRKHRERKKGQVNPDPVTGDVTRDKRVTNGVSHGVSHTTPTRPDPTNTTTGPYVTPGRTARAPQAPPDPGEPPPSDAEPSRVELLLTEYRENSPRGVPSRQAERLAAEIHRLVQDGYTDLEIRAALGQLRVRRLGPAMLAGLVDELANTQTSGPPGTNVVHLGTARPKPSTTDQRVQAALAVAQRFEQEDT